jgi:hypothetical protein
VTPIWMTDEEAERDWFAYADQRSRKLDHAKSGTFRRRFR